MGSEGEEKNEERTWSKIDEGYISQNRITVPKELRKRKGLKNGYKVRWYIDNEGEVYLKFVKITEEEL